jgi:hypothetical protein
MPQQAIDPNRYGVVTTSTNGGTSNGQQPTPEQIVAYYTQLTNGGQLQKSDGSYATPEEFQNYVLTVWYPNDVELHGQKGSTYPEINAQILNSAAASAQPGAESVLPDATSFHPGRSRYDDNGNLVFDTYNNPGVSLDPAAYQQTQQELADTASLRALAAVSKDADRYGIAPNAVPTISTSGVKKYREVSGDQFGQAFAPTQTALNGASEATLAASGNPYQAAAGSALTSAALGTAPSQAELLLREAQARNEAQTRVNVNALSAQQAALAAGTRGNVSGLASLNAQNNTALGQAQLYQQSADQRQQMQYQAAAQRAGEMTDARAALASFAQAVRAGDYQGAAQLAQIAQQQYGVSQAELQNLQNNVAVASQTDQFNAEQARIAAEGNAGRAQQALLANQQTAASVGSSDATMQAQLQQSLVDAGNVQQNQRIGYETDYAGIISQNADRAANERTGNQTLAESKRQFNENQTDRYIGGLIQAGGTVLGAAVAGPGGAAAGGAAGGAAADAATGSDMRAKHVGAARSPADFRATQDAEWSYKDNYTGPRMGGPNDHVGPMAQELPDDVQYTEDGKRVVNLSALAMRLAGSVGDLQRKIYGNGRA